MKQSAITTTAVLALALLASGCSISRLYSGAPLRAEPSLIVEGQSTRHDVLALLGPPEQIQHQTSGDVFIYRYRQVNASSITIRDPFFTNQLVFQFSRQFDGRDLLVVLFNFNGVVDAVSRRDDIKDLPILGRISASMVAAIERLKKSSCPNDRTSNTSYRFSIAS